MLRADIMIYFKCITTKDKQFEGRKKRQNETKNKETRRSIQIKNQVSCMKKKYSHLRSWKKQMRCLVIFDYYYYLFADELIDSLLQLSLRAAGKHD